MTKVCAKCGLPKDVSAFGKNSKHRDGLASYCRPCKSIYDAAYKAAHQDEIVAATAAYKAAHQQEIATYNLTHKVEKYAYNTRYVKERVASDVEFKLRCNLRSRLRRALKRGSKSGSAVKDLGCSILELKVYLEKLFQPGMTWENHGKGEGKWNIDHIKPLASFDLTDRQQFLVANHYTNLQPLWEEDNLRKGDREAA